jgi:hypothetical protein
MKVKFNIDYDEHPYTMCEDGVEIEVTPGWWEDYKENLRRYNGYQDQIRTMIVEAKAELRRKKKIDEVYQP